MLTEVTVDLRTYALRTVQRAAAALSAQYITSVAKEETHARVSLRPRFDAVPESEAIADFLASLTELSILDKLTRSECAAY